MLEMRTLLMGGIIPWSVDVIMRVVVREVVSVTILVVGATIVTGDTRVLVVVTVDGFREFT